jgi:two-component system cell cycle sensor histidine kinase/response regulator CckA
VPNSIEIAPGNDAPSHGESLAAAYSAMFTASPRGIILCDGETHKVLEANPSAQSILGITSSDTLGKTLLELPVFCELSDLNGILQQLVTEKYIQVDDISIKNQSSGTVVVDVSLHSYLVGTKRITECDLQVVTARKRREQRERRRHTIEALARMSGRVAGELNALLPVIAAASEMALVQPSYHALEEVQKARARLAKLERELLAFSGKQNLQYQPVDLNHVLASIEAALGGLLGEAIHLWIQPAPELPRVKADPVQLQQVIRTLAGFAPRRMPSGGELQISAALAEVSDSTLRETDAPPGQYVRLMLADSGPLVDDRSWRQLFEPFQDTAPGDEESGHGLDLASVYGAIKQSGGYLAVSSSPAGLTFQIYLPEAVGSLAPAAEGAVLSPSETILICDEEEGMRNLMRNLLSRKGYQVLEAEGVEQLRRILGDQAHNVDLLLADASAAEPVRGIADSHPHLKVLYIRDSSPDSGTQSGALPPQAAVLEKPFRLDALLARLQAVLHNGAS